MQINESIITSNDKKVLKILESYLDVNNVIIQILSRARVFYFYRQEIKLEPRLFNFLLELAKCPNEAIDYHNLDGKRKIEKQDYSNEVEYKLAREDQMKRVRNSKYELLKILKKVIEKKIKEHEEEQKKLVEHINSGAFPTRTKRKIKKIFSLEDFALKSTELYRKSFIDPEKLIKGVSKKGFKLALDDNKVIVGI